MSQTNIAGLLEEMAPAFFDRIFDLCAELGAIADDPCAPPAGRDFARRLLHGIDAPTFAQDLALGDWDDVSRAFCRTANFLAAAEGLARRLRRSELVPALRTASSNLWTLIWRWNVDVDGLSHEMAQCRLSRINPRFHDARSIHHEVA